ncbi:MAG: RagB/SusD family nutrient uptake outer membrane protein [Bacteroidales bacterium]|nr:RagB/SusD family nutrient uptake outer membrane protein [Bacteroidales bacterium]
MKKIYLLAALFASLTFASCEDFLDKKPDDQMDEEEVFTRYNKVDGLVTKIYEDAKSANRPLVFMNHFSSAPLTDECEGSSAEGSLTNKFNDGAWNPSGMMDKSSCGQYWWSLYAKIRNTNVFLDGVKKYNTPDDILEPGNLENRIGEVYFFRAYYHYLLIRMYGEVPYLDYQVDPNGSMTFKKESYHAVVDKICADAMEAYNRVPDRNQGGKFGRVDKGACLGLIAMVRWMDATPMWNGGKFPNDTRDFKDEYTYSQARWEAARDAAKAVLDFKVSGAQRYNLYMGGGDADTFLNDNGQATNNDKVYKRLWNMFYDEASIEEEWVWFCTRDKNNYWQGDIQPPSFGGGSRQMPVQEQVDEYEYISPDGFGYPIYADRAKADGYDDENPYEGIKRDPRFYRDIAYHGSVVRNSVINTAEGSDKINASNSTTTGYFLRKLTRENYLRGNYGFVINGPAIWRLPEFIYIYAEAVNEISGPNQDIYDRINEVRARSFMAPMPTTVLSSKDLMREYIYRERRVELFYENNRLWQCRLYLEPTSDTETAKENAWESAGSDNNTRSQNYWPYPKTQHMINGMRPVEDPNGKIVVNGKHYKMERFNVEKRVFLNQHYLFPIMDDEIKRTPGLTQNPSW